VVALEARLTQGPHSLRASMRERLATDQPRLVYTLTGASHALLRGVQHSLRRPVALSRQREEQLIGHLRARRARLAADLIQRSLFDNRTERFAASHAAVLEEALTSSRHRLQELDSLGSLQGEGWRLTCAAVID
jgi:hypothetical protein